MNASERSSDRPGSGRNSLSGWLFRLARKELRETLRDRRTILTLVAMPVLVYPLLSIAFQRFLLSHGAPPADAAYAFGFESDEAVRAIVGLLQRGDKLVAEQDAKWNGASGAPTLDPNTQSRVEAELKNSAEAGSVPAEIAPHATSPEQSSEDASSAGPPDELTKKYGLPPGRAAHERYLHIERMPRDRFAVAVATGEVDLAFHIENAVDEKAPITPDTPVILEVMYSAGSKTSRDALEFVVRCLRAVNDDRVVQIFKKANVPDAPKLVTSVAQPVSTSGGPSPSSLPTLVPLILILMTITGAVYPAIDLTAGERERGTLESLIAAPAPRMGILIAKYIAVLTVAVLTAAVNLAAMAITIQVGHLGPLLFGDEGLSFAVVLQIFGLLILFASFFSAVLLALTSFARSFKEAQAYLIPLMLLALAPGLLSLLPGLDLEGILVVTPLLNIVLLARDLLGQQANAIAAVIVVLSTFLFAASALAIAARIFGTDAILYGSEASWSDLWRRPEQASDVPSMGSAWFCLGLMFPLQYVLGNAAMTLAFDSLRWQLALIGVLSTMLFAGIPAAASAIGRIRAVPAFALRRPPWLVTAGAIVAGLSAWVITFELVLLSRHFGFMEIDPRKFAGVQELVSQTRNMSVWWMLVPLAIIPALVEEFFFRGYLFAALRARNGAWQTILASAAIFGLFHVLVRDSLAIERLLPSTLLGILLGWIRERSGSLLPGVLLHLANNSIVLLIGRYEEQLKAAGFDSSYSAHLPVTWLAGGFVGLAVGIGLIAISRRGAAENAVSTPVSA